MKKFIYKNILAISIIFSSLFISLCILIEYKLDTLQKIFSIFGSLSLIIALTSYFYKKNQDKTMAVLDQISFFRKEIIIANDEFINFVRDKKGKEYTFARVRLDEPTIEYTRNNYIKESQIQVDLVKELNTLPKQSLILNMLEEMSIKILHQKTTDHHALNSIKAPFIELIEINAIVLLMQRNIFTGIPTYSSILEIYSKWKDLVDRRSPQEREKEIMIKILNPKS
jgi:hypothetical protein